MEKKKEITETEKKEEKKATVKKSTKAATKSGDAKKTASKAAKKTDDTPSEIGINAADIEGATVDGKYLLYNGKPLVRNDKVIVYGDMTDDYILFLGIMTTKTTPTENGPVEVPDSIMIQILKTDTSIPAASRMVKQAIKNGLYEAMEVGLAWLKRANEGKTI